MNIPLDESLQSFLFRQQMLFAGKLDPKKVITRNGMWYLSPYAHQEVQHIFHRLDDSILLEAAEIGEPIRACQDGIFTSSDDYCMSLWSIFFNNGKQDSRMINKTKIRFCQACVNEAIFEYGYGYFKHQWVRNTWCYLHELPLRHLTRASYKHAIEDVKEVLAGGIPINEVCTQTRPSGAVESLSVNNSKELELLFAVHAPYCLGRLLANWLTLNFSKLSEVAEFLTKVEWAFLPWNLLNLPIDSNDYSQALRKLNALIVSFRRNSSLNEYISEHVEYVKVFVSPRGQLSEVMMLPKLRDCQSCAKNKSCSFLKFDYNEIKEEIDLQFLFHHSSSFKRYAIDQGQISLTGDYMWMPFRINSFLSEEDLESGELMEFVL
ncbi:hypothetical protein QDG88_20890 [Pseudoalteromonas piscicida]|uniref:hypothetical protein n=1 Tax=Pseudoalteromonas piscicida TaxID=43662 RepID=UPI002738F841|nr:hypothetical protein [Pseudoalteromonas piscicida]MDP4490375.1 hypothetical protein [Pseudoalteromonas piscicida]